MGLGTRWTLCGTLGLARRIVFPAAVALVAVMSCVSPANASPIYIADNGVSGGSAGGTIGNNILVGNYFTTLLGFNNINAISVYWDALPRATVTLAIIDDPNGDHSLSADAVILESFTVSPVAGDVGTFVSYGFAPVSVSGGFLVAAFYTNPGGSSPIPFDNSGVNFGGSRASQGTGSTLLFLARTAPTFPPDGTWMIRADATAVPEPSTWLLLGTGLAAVAARRRSAKRD